MPQQTFSSLTLFLVVTATLCSSITTIYRAIRLLLSIMPGPPMIVRTPGVQDLPTDQQIQQLYGGDYMGQTVSEGTAQETMNQEMRNCVHPDAVRITYRNQCGLAMRCNICSCRLFIAKGHKTRKAHTCRQVASAKVSALVPPPRPIRDPPRRPDTPAEMLLEPMRIAEEAEWMRKEQVNNLEKEVAASRAAASSDNSNPRPVSIQPEVLNSSIVITKLQNSMIKINQMNHEMTTTQVKELFQMQQTALRDMILTLNQEMLNISEDNKVTRNMVRTLHEQLLEDNKTKKLEMLRAIVKDNQQNSEAMTTRMEHTNRWTRTAISELGEAVRSPRLARLATTRQNLQQDAHHWSHLTSEELRWNRAPPVNHHPTEHWNRTPPVNHDPPEHWTDSPLPAGHNPENWMDNRANSDEIAVALAARQNQEHP